MKRILVFAGILFAPAYHHAHACNVPAFRYALERWPADPYQILVYHDSAPQGEAYDVLHKGAANYALRRVDVATPEGKALARQRKIAAFPWVEVFYPAHFQSRTPLWSGPLTAEGARRILDSPARSAIARQLLEGEVAVWVLLKSGQERQDSRALQALETNLAKASALRIPEVGTDLNGDPVEVKEFRSYPVHFGLTAIERGDPHEQLLVNALLDSETDLAQHDEPIAFPVFGRGRALYALVGEGIQENTITEACHSLLAWCSCEIKAQNPGTDLLVSADWSRPYGGKMVVDAKLPPLAGLAAFREAPKVADAPAPAVAAGTWGAPLQQPRAAACTVVPAKPVVPPVLREDRLVRNVLWLAAAAGLVLAAVSIVVAARTRNVHK